MTTLTHTISLIHLKCSQEIIDTINNLPDTFCYILKRNLTSITLGIQIKVEVTLDDVLSIGTLIGSIETKSLI